MEESRRYKTDLRRQKSEDAIVPNHRSQFWLVQFPVDGFSVPSSVHRVSQPPFSSSKEFLTSRIRKIPVLKTFGNSDVKAVLLLTTKQKSFFMIIWDYSKNFPGYTQPEFNNSISSQFETHPNPRKKNSVAPKPTRKRKVMFDDTELDPNLIYFNWKPHIKLNIIHTKNEY